MCASAYRVLSCSSLAYANFLSGCTDVVVEFFAETFPSHVRSRPEKKILPEKAHEPKKKHEPPMREFLVFSLRSSCTSATESNERARMHQANTNIYTTTM